MLSIEKAFNIKRSDKLRTDLIVIAYSNKFYRNAYAWCSYFLVLPICLALESPILPQKMIRSWIRLPTKQISERIQKANDSSFYILQELGPTGFLLKSAGGSQKWKVLIGSSHSCNCPQFSSHNGSCIHIVRLLIVMLVLDFDQSLSDLSGIWINIPIWTHWKRNNWFASEKDTYCLW